LRRHAQITLACSHLTGGCRCSSLAQRRRLFVGDAAAAAGSGAVIAAAEIADTLAAVGAGLAQGTATGVNVDCALTRQQRDIVLGADIGTAQLDIAIIAGDGNVGCGNAAALLGRGVQIGIVLCVFF